MKKLMLALFAIAALVALEADARWGKCGTRACGSNYKCAERVEEQACPVAPCCVKYARVTFPAKRVKHISYSWECPDDCTEEGAIAVGSSSAAD